MLVFATLLMVASVATGTGDTGGRGVEIATARVQAAILEPARVRQGSGHERVGDRPVPQITRRAGEVLVEFQ
jgi:hypothetical protein